jgi:hypothetical protein
MGELSKALIPDPEDAPPSPVHERREKDLEGLVYGVVPLSRLRERGEG